MAVNLVVAKALSEDYTRDELVLKRKEATAEVLAGVQVTQVNFEGGGASGRAVLTPAELVELISAAIGLIDAPGNEGRANSAFVDLSGRTWGT